VHDSVPVSDDEVLWQFSMLLFLKQFRQFPIFLKK
jgi:hypothetical protein